MTEFDDKSFRYVTRGFFDHRAIRPYLANVRNWQGYVRFLGLPDRRDNPDIIIDRLFVEPLLVRRYVSPDEKPIDWLHEAEPILEALSRNTRFVLLGDPGIGKSTFLNYVAWLLSRPTPNALSRRLGWGLPLPMVLRELPLRGVRDFDGLLGAFLSRPMCAPLRKNGAEYLRQSLADGQAYLLLDGIDEVGSRKAREDLRSAVFDGLQKYPKCRWLLSSRIVGYDEVPFDRVSYRSAEEHVTGEESVVIQDTSTGSGELIYQRRRRKSLRNGLKPRYIAPFDDQRIMAFAQNWYVQRVAAATQARADASHLVTAIRADQAILRLARIPNLLTMMALIHRVEATLPHGRALLYDRITEAYLESIDKYRGIDLGPHELPRKKKWLARVGFEMQRRRTEQNNKNEAEILVEFDTVINWLNQEMEGTKDSSNSPSAEEFLGIIGRRSGLFLPRGEKRYAFVHLSFQEYFAAVALAREVTRLLWARDKQSKLGFDSCLLAEWASKSVWCETFSFVFESLASQEEDDWHDELLNCIFGRRFDRLNEWNPSKEDDDGLLNLGILLARLVVNSRSGLTVAERKEAIAICVKVQLQIQSGRQSWMPSRMGSHSIIKVLLGNDDELDAEVYQAIHVQSEEMIIPKLDFAGARISDVSGLGNLVDLQVLHLNGTQVSDLGPLSKLTALKRLNLEGTQVSDLDPLSKLTALKRLNLEGTQVSDLDPLSKLTALEWLNLEGTQVSDLGPLSKLTALKRLNLEGTQVSDLGPLSKLTALEWLNLERTQVSDLGPLSKLTALEWLNLEGTQVSGLGPLSNLSALQALHLDRTGVSDISPLSNLTALRLLDLDRTRVSDISPLSNLTALRLLDLDRTRVSDISPLSNLSALQSLHLDRTGVSDISPLSNLAALRLLDLDRTRVSDISPLSNLTELRLLNLDGTQVSDISPLESLQALERLDLEGTQVSDIAALLGLKALTWLDLDNTQVLPSAVRELQKALPKTHIFSSSNLPAKTLAR